MYRRSLLDILGPDLKPLTQQTIAVSKRFSVPTSKCLRYKVKFGDTLLMIAYNFYGTSDYWREIADQNKIIDPLDIAEGQLLFVPFLSEVALGF